MEPQSDMDRIFRQLEAIQVQLREMTASFSANLSEHSNAITRLNEVCAAKAREDELLHEAINDRFEKDEQDINRAFARFKDLSGTVEMQFNNFNTRLKAFEDAQQQIEGARKVWIVVISAITAIGAVLGLIRFFSH